MKKSLILFCLFSIALSFANAQVAIGKNSVDGSAILDFVIDSDKGISLPKITALSSTSVEGTLFFDTNDNKVKALIEDTANPGNIIEMDLSRKTGTFSLTANGYDALTEAAGQNGTILGANSSSAPGALVLESANQAMVLPKMANPHLVIANPEPGMIAYDTVKKVLMVYNGDSWSFWGE